MQPKTYKEARSASIEMLFHFFKALPSSYYAEREQKINGSTTQIFKNLPQTFKKVLNRKSCGFDYIEITGVYLCAFDQKILRGIMQLLQKQEEKLFDATKSSILDEDYILTPQPVYSNQVSVSVRDFYALLNNKVSNRSNKDIIAKLIKSLQRLSTTIMSFYTKKKCKVLTAPLLVYSKLNDILTFQLHPVIMTYEFSSKNNDRILKYQQHFYLIDNSDYFTSRTDLQMLIYTKVQYKFASMNQRYKSYSIDLEELRVELFLPSKSSQTNYNQTAKLKKALIQLNFNSEYNIELSPHSKHTTITVTKKDNKEP